MEVHLRPLSQIADKDPLIGLFSEEPELVDQILEYAMHSRERDSLRPTNE